MDDGTMLPVSEGDYDLLDEVRKANDWTVKEAIHRAIRAIWTLDQQLQAMKHRHQGDVGELIGRLRGELDPEFLVCPKQMSVVESYDDRPVRIRIDDFMFYAVDWALVASRILDLGDEDRLEIYLVHDGRLTLKHSGAYSGPPDPEGVELT